jgi:uncharacterized protein
MSASGDFQFSAKDFSGRVRLLPLPNRVFFPQMVVPLRISEARYRALVDDALAGDRLIALAILAPGWESDYQGSPPLRPVACLGRIAACQPGPDGGPHIVVHTLRRVRLIRELPQTKGFREAEAQVLDDYVPADDPTAEAELRRRLREAISRILPTTAEVADAVADLFKADMPLGLLADVIASMLDIGLAWKEALLAETDVRQRAEMLLGHLAAAADDDRPGAAGVFEFPPPFDVN